MLVNAFGIIMIIETFCSKSKQFVYYEDCFDKDILYINDLLNPPHSGAKIFDKLILDFDVSPKDRSIISY